MNHYIPPRCLFHQLALPRAQTYVDLIAFPHLMANPYAVHSPLYEFQSRRNIMSTTIEDELRARVTELKRENDSLQKDLTDLKSQLARAKKQASSAWKDINRMAKNYETYKKMWKQGNRKEAAAMAEEAQKEFAGLEKKYKEASKLVKGVRKGFNNYQDKKLANEMDGMVLE
jgi:archaellum component FlaC